MSDKMKEILAIVTEARRLEREKIIRFLRALPRKNNLECGDEDEFVRWSDIVDTIGGLDD